MQNSLLNRRSFIFGTVAGLTSALAISPYNQPIIRYTPRDYFREFQDMIPAPSATYRNGKLVEFTGWLPEIIRARGVPNPDAQFFYDWLSLLHRRGLVKHQGSRGQPTS